jgi:hypothetical protein
MSDVKFCGYLLTRELNESISADWLFKDRQQLLLIIGHVTKL